MSHHSGGLGCTGTPAGWGSWSATLPCDRTKGQGQPTLRAAWWELQDGEELPIPSLVWAGPTALLGVQAQQPPAPSTAAREEALCPSPSS